MGSVEKGMGSRWSDGVPVRVVSEQDMGREAKIDVAGRSVGREMRVRGRH